MGALEDLYQEVLVDHGRHPHNFRALEAPTHQAEGHNPLCGDQITVYLKVVDDRIEDVTFQGQGCTICTATASLMTRRLKGLTLNDADAVFDAFHHLVTTGDLPQDNLELGELEALQGVAQYPVRVKCATLPWHAYRAAVKHQQTFSTTE
jgi:nitrogen fixation NifU-like protein